ncbi:MAG: 50S ribosomal protein L6 [Candidatus Doudnabacteria bacterium]|nr:50S ribosomal protein L6 [Candidatus Doudnabacteria bacterium]
MSKLARKPIMLPAGVEAKVEGSKLVVAGVLGKQSLNVSALVQVSVGDAKITTAVKDRTDRRQRALWGTTHSLIANMVKGVTEGYSKKLEVVGVGYRVSANKEKVTLQLGHSHPVELAIPAGLEVKVEKNLITVSGIDKQLVGQFSALIRQQRKPEPYKGKGVKYSDEVIRRKAGKVVKAVGA